MCILASLPKIQKIWTEILSFSLLWEVFKKRLYEIIVYWYSVRTKFFYSPLKILWTYKKSAKNLKIRFWFYAFLYFYFFKNLFIIISENKSWWNLYWNTDGYLCNCASSLMCCNSFSGCPNFYLRLSHFPFCFNIPPNLQLHWTILDGYQIWNYLTLCT